MHIELYLRECRVLEHQNKWTAHHNGLLSNDWYFTGIIFFLRINLLIWRIILTISHVLIFAQDRIYLSNIDQLSVWRELERESKK